MTLKYNNYDKNSKIIIIPEGIKKIPADFFKSYTNLEEIIIPDSVVEIGHYAFSGCTSLKKIKLSKNLKTLEPFAFTNCFSLEEIIIPETLTYIDNGVFSYCKNLKTLILHDNIEYIEDYGLYKCENLQNFELPKNINSLGIKALCGCNKIKEIIIPKNLKDIDTGALSLMSSLERINVDIENKKYITKSDDILMDKNGNIIQYAINSKRKTCDITYPNLDIYNIHNYAFAGAKNLETIIVTSEIESIGPKTFLNCEKLKNLTIRLKEDNETLLFSVPDYNCDDVHVPFENIIINEGIIALADNMHEIFANAINVKLPDSLEYIGSNIFTNSKKLHTLRIPKGIKIIYENTFYENLILEFEEFIKIKANEFCSLQTKTEFSLNKRIISKDNIRIFSLTNGTHYITIDDYETIEITNNQIKNLSPTSYLLIDNPNILIRYLYNILSINDEYHETIIKYFKDESLKELFESFTNNKESKDESKQEKYNKFIHKILQQQQFKDEILFNELLIQNISKEDIIIIINNMSLSLERFIKYSEYFNNKDSNKELQILLKNLPKLINYCNLLEKYQLYDRFLYKVEFFVNLTNDEQELILKNYNLNLKRLLKFSEVLETKDYGNHNLRDLLKFLNIMGVFSTNKILSQKTCNFITEKIFLKNKPNGTKNENRIVGDDIHRIFENISLRELNLEFILFFIENYKELILIEKSTSGFIARIHNSFREISKCTTSDKGEQKQKKVTIDKCKYFFLINRYYYNIDQEYKKLGELLSKYYTEEKILEAAISIIKESKNSPRNIFTKNTIDENGNIKYDNDPKHDLRGINNHAFSFEWLPKQFYDNLILGKYCNCCAHVNGHGAGIMRASMINDSCQNLVIRNGNGDIVAKSTIWINRPEQYAVYNTIEINLNNRNEHCIPSIYEAFIKGTEEFLRTYNINNPDKPILNITVGKNRNCLKDYLLFKNHKEIDSLKAINFSSFCYTINNEMVGTYNGDHEDGQILILSKKLV